MCFGSPQAHKPSRALLNRSHAVMGLPKPRGPRGTGTKLFLHGSEGLVVPGARHISGQAKTMAQNPGWWGEQWGDAIHQGSAQRLMLIKGIFAWLELKINYVGKGNQNQGFEEALVVHDFPRNSSQVHFPHSEGENENLFELKIDKLWKNSGFVLKTVRIRIEVVQVFVQMKTNIVMF